MPDARLNKRLVFFGMVLALCALVLILQYASVMLAAAPARNGNPHLMQERGPILDRNGRMLAAQTTVYTLSAWPDNLEDPVRTAHLVAPLIGADPESLAGDLSLPGSARVLADHLDQKTADALRDLMSREGLKGLLLEEQSVRTWPLGDSASQILGFTGRDNQGLEGLEYRFNDLLSGASTLMPDGKAWGRQLVLTIDSVVQQAVEAMADRTLATYQASGVLLYVMEARTGEILAWANRPGYDPNHWQTSRPEDRRNMGTGYLYEPGSVFKVFSVSSFLERNRISDGTLFMTSRGYRNPQFRDPITDMADYGTLTTSGIIVHSSNVGAALASDTVSNEEFHTDLLNWGFGAPTGIELPGEERGLLKAPSQWTPRTKPTLAFGQEISVTSVQVLQAATVVANEGMMLRPRLVKEVRDMAGTVLESPGPAELRQVMKPAVAALMRDYMHAATGEDGTGHRSRVDGIDLAVKTGTAQMTDRVHGGYSRTDYIASALGMFPASRPELVVYAVIIRPRGETLGGRIAAPLIKEAAEFLIPYRGITREGDQVVETSPQIQIRIPSLPLPGDTLPDYRGLPLRTVMGLHKIPGLVTEMEGSGFVTSQDPPPGTPYTEGMHLVLRLSDPANPPPGAREADTP